LTAPDEEAFFEMFDPWWSGAIEAWCSDLPVLKPEVWPFYVATLAKHDDRESGKPGHVHAHLIVGNLPLAEVAHTVESWPFFFQIENTYQPWGWLHYISSQQDPREHWEKPGLIRVLHRWVSPTMPVLEAWAQYSNAYRSAEAASDGARSKARGFTVSRAQKAARARWAKRHQHQPGGQP